jgi:hypothetical protein
MKRALSIILAVECIIMLAQSVKLQSLEKELARLKVDTALVFPSSAIDEEPVWSPNGEQLAVQVQGHWIKVDLTRLSLETAIWHGKQPIGVITDDCKGLFEKASEDEIKKWRAKEKWNATKIVTKKGTSIELRQEELSTSLIITRKGKPPNTIWSSGVEVCGSIALSPDEKYFAFIAETNGVMIMMINE